LGKTKTKTKGDFMETIKKVFLAIVIVAGMTLLLVADAKMGESECGEGKYNQTTGECIAD
jgi:hypothetical protein